MEIKTGFFTMEHISAVCSCKDINEARKIAIAAINAQSSAKPENKAKAIAMVNKHVTPNNLGIAMTNFFFAHPSENLKTIRL